MHHSRKDDETQVKKTGLRQGSKYQAVERGSVVMETVYSGSAVLAADMILPTVIQVNCSGLLQPEP